MNNEIRMPSLAAKISNFLREPWLNKVNRISAFYYLAKGAIFYRTQFASFGSGSAIHTPMLINNPQFMHIGRNVLIRSGVRLQAVVVDPKNPPELRIGNNVNIEQDVHIVVLGKVVIEDDVSITARASILGGTHPFLDVFDSKKIGDRIAGADSITRIGEGCFLGVGSVIQMNVKLGRRVVVGSGCVVTRNAPDYSVISGNPGTIVMRYVPERDQWTVSKSK